MIWPAMGAIALLLGVAAGAFGAHGLREKISPEMLAVWETAVRYQMWHGLSLLVVGLHAERLGGAATVCTLYLAGIVMFSGSLYLLALGGPRWLGPVTPIGGTAWLVGHGWLAWSLILATRSG